MPEPALPPTHLPFAALLRGESGDQLQLDEPLWLTRAPGRLDLLGGPGEGSGSATLSLPLARSVYCAIQNRQDQKIHIRSLLPAARGGNRVWEGEVATLYTKKGPPRSLAVLNQVFEEEDDQWMMRVIAAMLGLRRTRQLNTPKHGFTMVIWSRLPDEVGFGERAALGTAVALAFKGATGLAKKRVDGIHVARAVVLGAREVLEEQIPLTEALTSALGRRNCLLYIEHGIDLAMQWVPIPEQAVLAAVDIGATPEVEEGEPAPEDLREVAEVGAAMALSHLNAALKKDGKMPFPGWGRLSPKEFDAVKSQIPTMLKGADWLKRFRRSKDLADLVPLVDKDRGYRTRALAEFSVAESERVRRLTSNLAEYARTVREGFLVEAGRNLNRSQKAIQDVCKIRNESAEALLSGLREKGRDGGMFGGRLADFGRAGIMSALLHQSSRQPIRDLAGKHRVAGAPHVNVVTETEDGGVLSGWWHGVLEPKEAPADEDGGEAAAGRPEPPTAASKSAK